MRLLRDPVVSFLRRKAREEVEQAKREGLLTLEGQAHMSAASLLRSLIHERAAELRETPGPDCGEDGGWTC